MKIILPDDFTMPPGGLNIRPRDNILEQEARLHEYKRAAAIAFVRANRLNHLVTSGGQRPTIGIITTGKSYLDVRQAFDDLGLDEASANALGIRLYKVACPWPLSQAELVAFARGLKLIMVVEEKRSLIEVQVREELYGTANQPVIVGKKDEAGDWLFPVKGALDPNDIAIALGERLLRFHPSEDLAGRVARLRETQAVMARTVDAATRTPYFCSGCPHNSSTKVPDGMRAYAGIGCHYMVQWMDRATEGFTQMGGEGANWIGEAPFSTRGHVFQNLGDGTYNHSGVLALRWAIATNTNVTYKILFNDAVAMTGGQHHEGNLTVDRIARQVRAEGWTASRLSPTIRTNIPPASNGRPGSASTIAAIWRPCSATSRRCRACRFCSMTRPARPRSAGGASAGSIRIRTGASSSTNGSARAAAIAASSRTACRSSRWKPNSAASARSTSRAATRTFPA